MAIHGQTFRPLRLKTLGVTTFSGTATTFHSNGAQHHGKEDSPYKQTTADLSALSKEGGFFDLSHVNASPITVIINRCTGSPQLLTIGATSFGHVNLQPRQRPRSPSSISLAPSCTAASGAASMLPPLQLPSHLLAYLNQVHFTQQPTILYQKSPLQQPPQQPPRAPSPHASPPSLQERRQHAIKISFLANQNLASKDKAPALNLPAQPFTPTIHNQPEKQTFRLDPQLEALEESLRASTVQLETELATFLRSQLNNRSSAQSTKTKQEQLIENLLQEAAVISSASVKNHEAGSHPHLASGTEALSRCDLSHTLYNLYQCFVSGIGTHPNSKLALYYLQIAAKLGHPESLYNLGVHYSKGELGLPVSHTTSFDLLSSAAAKGLYEAQTALALCHYYGKGCTKSMKLAFHWFSLVVDDDNNAQSDPLPHHYLSVFYEYGCPPFLARDLLKASIFRNKAAQLGFRPSSDC